MKSGDTMPASVRKKRRNDEFKLTCAVAEYLQLLENQGKLTYCHVPMGEIRNARTGAKLKKMGARAGMPDFLVWGSSEKGMMHTFNIAIELKSKDGRMSDNQKSMKARLLRHGCSTYEARSLDDVMSILRDEDVI